MGEKYSDFIRIKESKPAYNISREELGEWDSFIPNDQFNNILETFIRSVRNNDQDAHKSFWLDGTYGTGKSHAAAVIMHLLSDKVEDIEDFMNTEYRGPKFNLLRESLFKLRRSKRLFPVNLYGREKISHKQDLSYALQSAIKKAIDSIPELAENYVKTDFDSYADHVKAEPNLWRETIESSNELKAYALNVDVLEKRLRDADSSILTHAKKALANRRIDIRLDKANISDWFFEVQDLLVSKTDYSGLLIIWDEFTDISKSDIGPSLLVDLQSLTERAMDSGNNSYFFFISHPSALNNLDKQEREKTKGRYHYMKYDMQPMSAFKIMSRKLKVVDGKESEYKVLTDNFFYQNPSMLERYIQNSNDKEDTKKDLMRLFPLHPATANLATYYAKNVGSSSRSVFEFIGDNPVFKAFLEDESVYFAKRTITADMLWDYVLKVFTEDQIKYGAVTERFNSYKLKVSNTTKAHTAVFKGILLLNALNNIANDDNVTPSEENIKNLFLGTEIESNIENILNWMNTEGVIQKAPGGLFSIQFSALPPIEIENTKRKMKADDFKYTYQILEYGIEVDSAFKKNTKNIKRPKRINFYSLLQNGYALESKILKDKEKANGFELHLAMMLAKNEKELSELKSSARKMNKDSRFHNTCIFVFDELFGNERYEQFIEYMANAECARQHGLGDQKIVHTKYATTLLYEWMTKVRTCNFTYYVNGKEELKSSTRLASIVNETISPYIFSDGIESLPEFLRTPTTFWENKQAKATAQAFLLSSTKDEIIGKSTGAAHPLKYLLQDAVDEDLKFKEDVDKEHPLYIMSEFIKRKIDRADKGIEFNFYDKFKDLTKPPYGVYPSFGGIALIAFALRPYVDKIFDIHGKPRTSSQLADDVMLLFKSFQSGKNSDRLKFMFETKEAGKLSKSLIEIFKLRELSKYSDVSSLKDARWAISNAYVKAKNYPLWSLKYLKENEELRETIDNILKVVADKTINKNPAFMMATCDLLQKFRFELIGALNKEDSFREGFNKFLLSREKVNLQADELQQANTYIKQHLEGEVGFWQEKEVEDKLKDWRLNQQLTPDLSEKDETERYGNYPIDSPEEGHMSGEKSSNSKQISSDQVEKANIIVDSLKDINDAKDLLHKIIETAKGNSNLVQIIQTINYVSEV